MLSYENTSNIKLQLGCQLLGETDASSASVSTNQNLWWGRLFTLRGSHDCKTITFDCVVVCTNILGSHKKQFRFAFDSVFVNLAPKGGRDAMGGEATRGETGVRTQSVQKQDVRIRKLANNRRAAR